MEKKIQWRFPTVKGGQATGLTTGDKETFKKNPYSSLAREILQNSIDVSINDSEPVEVEFKKYDIYTNEIPDVEGIKSQISRCKNYWSHKKDYCEVYDKMSSVLEKERISCLRISDFNTSGLRGVRSKDYDGNRFLALTKGTGVSEKGNNNAGGSKGVGKNAAIEQSALDMIFYSTITDRNEIGTIGVANFVSGYPKENCGDDNIFTQGAGYLSDNDNNDAIENLITFDSGFNRNGRTGTDIDIIGFRANDDKWINEVVSSVIDSFIVAIYRHKLVVRVNDIEISKENLDYIINDSGLITNKDILNNAICNLKLLNGDDVKIFDIETDYGSPKLYVLPLKREEEELATHACAMIRYPYMKIKSYSQNKNYRVAAMCIIENGKLGELLRQMENPEHTDWQLSRLDGDVRAEGKAVLSTIQQQISDRIQEVLKIGGESSLDPNRAGEFLPSIDKGNTGVSSGDEQKDDNDQAKVSKFKDNNTFTDRPTSESDEGDAVEPDIGKIEGEGDTPYPEGENDGNGGDVRSGNGRGEYKDGDTIVLRNTDKTSVKYKFMAIDKNRGAYKIVFISPANYEQCFLNLKIVDVANDKEDVEIESLVANGIQIESDDSVKFGPFSIKTNEKMVLEISTKTQKGLFASEVRVLCK